MDNRHIRMTPQTADELRIAAEIVQYHFLRSRQKELIFHMHPSCESKQEIDRKDVINYNYLKENNKPTLNRIAYL